MGSTISWIFNIFQEKDIKAKILICGLDNAGKTLLLYRWRLNEVVSTVSTIGFNVEHIVHDRVEMTVWDLGGQDKLQAIWRHYYDNVSGVIYVIDSCDTDRLEETKNLLHKMLHEMSNNVAVLIMANKQDMPTAIPSYQVSKELELSTELIRNRFIYVQCCSAKTGEGVHSGLEKLVKALLIKHRTE